MLEHTAVFVDVRWYPDGRDTSAEFRANHITGARFVDLDTDLCGSDPDEPATAGRHPFPTPDHFAARLGRLGIADDTHVIAYDVSGGMTAARLVVMLRMIGRSASLLDGGLPVWSALFPDLVTGGASPKVSSAHFTPVEWPDHVLVSDGEFVELTRRDMASTGSLLLDARAAERFQGTAPAGPGTLDPRAGHIPGAVNAPWMSVMSPESGRLRPIDELRSHFAQLGVADADDVIASCGSGVSACVDILAIEHAGFPPPRLYVPSWSGWASDPDRPIEVGPVAPNVSRLRTGAHRHRWRAVHDLRAARRRRRLADLEWFEAIYRVYLAVFVFGGGIAFISGFVPDDALSPSSTTEVWTRGPAWLGLGFVLAIAVGLRSGSRGGPIAIEEADVRHVLLAPIDRRRAMLRPAVQSLRTASFTTMIIGTIAGYLAARRLPGSAPAWMFWGAVWGASAGLVFIGCAVIAHVLRLHPWISGAIGTTLVGWQVLSALPRSYVIHLDIAGPGDLHGELALASHGIRLAAFIPVTIGVLACAIGLILVGRLSVEALVRRSALVSQLRFAVTVQDLRTVTLLRRRLAHEQSRSRPWIALRKGHGPTPEWQRSVHGLMRFPAMRVGRIVVLCIVAGLGLVAAYHGTTPAIVVTGACVFMIGLELSEPLAQEIDQSDRTQSYPVARGLVHIHLLAPLGPAMVPLVGIMVLTATIADPAMWLVALVGSTIALAGGIAGAAVNIISGTPDPLNSTVRQNTMPPEVAGTASVIKMLWPLIVSVVSCLPVTFASVAESNGLDPRAAAVRSAIAITLAIGLIGGWMRFRDDIRRSFDRALTDSRS